MEGRTTVLMLDDEPFIMNATAQLLRGAGFDVHTCGDWSRLMGLIQETQPHLILLDYNMPTLKGDDICGALKRNLADRPVKIVIFSSEEDTKLERIVKECGADGYLSKTKGHGHIVDSVCGLLA